jgi:hypothetical protein
MTEPTETIAIDVVLMPPEPVMDIAISVNQTLLARNPDGGIRLNRTDCLPHISVAMAPIRQGDLHKVVAGLDRIVRRCSSMTLTIDSIAKHRTPNGEMVSVFHIPRIEILQLFHKSVMKAVEPHHAPAVGTHIFADREVSASSLDCLLRFPGTSAYKDYSPHITLGFGELPRIVPGVDLPLRFEVTKAALCHLGNHCTCREALAGFELRS